MKKSIFDLTRAERKKVEKELISTSYGKVHYLLANSVLIAVVFIFIVQFFTVKEGEPLFSDLFLLYLFSSFFVSIFLYWKWLKLVKVYYDEKQ